MNGAISFEIKAVDNATNPDGEFEAILSMPTLDRDGEIIDPKAFAPLPESIPIHKFHAFDEPVATAYPFYDGDVLKARGVFDPDADAQEFRKKVGRSVGFMSVGFMEATRVTAEDGTPHVTKAELLEASFVSIPSNREAAILAVKQHEAKVGSRNRSKDSERLQQIHDLAVSNGAECVAKTADVEATKSPADTTPELAAAEAAAAPAEVNVGTQALIAQTRATAALLLTT